MGGGGEGGAVVSAALDSGIDVLVADESIWGPAVTPEPRMDGPEGDTVKGPVVTFGAVALYFGRRNGVVDR